MNDKLTFICSVSADFIGPAGETFSITPAMSGKMVQAPMWVKDKPLFRVLLAEGAIRFVTKAEQEMPVSEPETPAETAPTPETENDSSEVPEAPVGQKRGKNRKADAE